MGIRGLAGALERGGWRRLNLVEEARRSGGVRIFVDFIAFVYTSRQTFCPWNCRLRAVSEGRDEELLGQIDKLFSACKKANIAIEFCGDPPKGLTNSEWLSRFQFYKMRFERRLADEDFFERDIERVRTENPGPYNDVAGLKSQAMPRGYLYQELRNLIRAHDIPFTLANCDKDVFMHALKVARDGNSAESKAMRAEMSAEERKVLEEAGQILGSLTDDTDHALMNGSVLLYMRSPSNTECVVYDEVGNLTSFIVDAASATDIIKFTNVRPSLRVQELPEVAVLACSEFTREYEEAFKPLFRTHASFYSAAHLVSRIPPTGGLRRVEGNEFIRRLMEGDGRIANSIYDLRKYYGFEKLKNGEPRFDPPVVAAVVEHCKRVVAGKQGLPERIPASKDLDEILWQMTASGLIWESLITIHQHGRSWESSEIEATKGPYVVSMLLPFAAVEHLMASPRKKSVSHIQRTESSIRTCDMTIPADRALAAPLTDIILPGDHDQRYAAGRYWPSVRTLTRMSADARLKIFFSIVEAFGSDLFKHAEDESGFAVEMADIIHKVTLESLGRTGNSSDTKENASKPSSSGHSGKGFVEIILFVIANLNRRFSPALASEKIQPWEMESIILCILLSFTRAINRFAPDRTLLSPRIANVIAEGKVVDPPIINLLHTDERLTLSRGCLLSATELADDEDVSGDTFYGDPLALLGCEDEPMGHEHLMVDMRSVTLATWAQVVIRNMLSMCGTCCLLSERNSTSFPDASVIRATGIIQMARVCSYFNARMFGWLQAAGALEQHYKTSEDVASTAWLDAELIGEQGTPHVRGGPVWVSADGRRILAKVARLRRHLLDSCVPLEAAGCLLERYRRPA